jgi:hypothetical protein
MTSYNQLAVAPLINYLYQLAVAHGGAQPNKITNHKQQTS